VCFTGDKLLIQIIRNIVSKTVVNFCVLFAYNYNNILVM